jgi:hypothetical protein
LRIVRALKTGELDPLDYLVIKFLVDEIEAPGRNSEAIYTLEELARMIGWRHTIEWLRKKVHALQAADWIDFDEPTRARNAVWVFRLKRAAIDGETSEPPSNLQPGTPSELEVTSNNPGAEDAANPQPESASEVSEPPTASVPRAEQSRAEIGNEEKLDHLGVETTTREPEFEEAPRLDEHEDNPFHDNADSLFDASIGVAPLGELWRLHESGEL